MPTDETQSPEESRELVVFSIVRDTTCSECKAELGKGNFITLRNREPLCMECADLDHLWFLRRGNTALTRRARKYAKLSPVVVKWSRARKRYERQGVLVEAAALDRAEEECLADEELRLARRERDRARREELDERFVKEFAERILELYPRCPKDEASMIAEHTCSRGSGRVGRTQAAKDFDETAVGLAVRASIRHRHTRYDELLMEGLDRDLARAEIADDVLQVENGWRGEEGG